MRKLPLLIACAALALHVAASADDRQADVERQTRFGKVVGIDDSDDSGTYAWKGIPFAKAPVGELRWKAPVDPERWHDAAHDAAVRQRLRAVRAHLRPGRQQPLRRDHRHHARPGRRQRGLPVPEHLAPGRRSHGNLPVIVFVHGGSNVSGYTADPVYDGAALARAANAVVVTVNYRLGIFGFLNLRAAEDGHRRAGGLGQLRAARHHQGAAVRPPRHRQVRRQPEQRHADGPVGRRDQRLRAADDAGHGRTRGRGCSTARCR